MMLDVWGQIYVDHWRGDPHPHVFERDDGNRNHVPSAANYFVAPRGNADRESLERLAGRVLDLGCGVGSYTRFLEDQGCEVVAVDASAGAIAVCRERGCRDARTLDIDDVSSDLGGFDAAICMGNTFGINAGPASLPDRFARIRSVLAPNGTLLLGLIDPLATTDPANLDYHARNRADGKPPGLATARIHYRGNVGEWWALWMPTPDELRAAASAGGFEVERTTAAGNSVLYELTPQPS